MRLDKATKKAIHREIMDDTPKVVKNDAQARQDIQDALVKAMSPLAKKLYKQNPKALASTHLSCWDYGFQSSFSVIVGDADIDKVLIPYSEAHTKRMEVSLRLEGVINGCSTLKQLKTLLPEFEKYMPSETEPAKNLPAVANIAADLTKLGWPKERK